MARKLRLEFAGACYHVFNRGNYRRDLFAGKGAAESFQDCLGEACVSFGWLIHAYAIMRNHFHLAVETPEPNLSTGMKWLQGTWALRFNRFHGECGRPFQGRYKAKHVEPGHALAQVAHYIHLNPARAGSVAMSALGKYRWSSLHWFPRGTRPTWLEPATVLRECGGLTDSRPGWRRYFEYLAVLAEETPRLRAEKFDSLSRGWMVGSAAFRAELRTELAARTERGGRFELLGAEAESVRQARIELWEERLREFAATFQIALNRLPPEKSAVDKLRLAAAMKQTTSASNLWLAQRLQTGAPGSLASLLNRFRKRRGMGNSKISAPVS